MNPSTRHNSRGFTLVELMMVVGIIAVLSSVTIDKVDVHVSRARRTEARIILKEVWEAQHGFFGSTGRYAANFDELGFHISNQQRLAPDTIQAHYYTFRLSQPFGELSFYCSGTANIDADPWPDVMVIEEGTPLL